MSEGSARRGGGRGCDKEWFSKTACSISNKNSKERLFILNAFLLTYPVCQRMLEFIARRDNDYYYILSLVRTYHLTL